MRFSGAARAARSGHKGHRTTYAGAIVILVLTMAVLSTSCSSSSKGASANHLAYVTLPAKGSVLQLLFNGTTGTITLGEQTPQVPLTAPSGLVLSPSKKFLYVANSGNDSISTFNVAPDGSLTQSGSSMPAGNGPNAVTIDPTGNYLLVTNSYGTASDRGDISVYQIDVTTGVLSEVAGSPFPANANPTDIVFTHSGQFVYVTSPVLGMVSGFLFCPPQQVTQLCSGTTPVLSSVPNSPVLSGKGPSALVVDPSDQFLYVSNVSAVNPPPITSTGNISGFFIDANTGALTAMPTSPFTSTNGVGPSALTTSPNNGPFIYAMTPGSSFSIWCFTINYQNPGDPTDGQLNATGSSPFSLPAGGLFALFDPSGSYLYIGSNAGVNGYAYSQSTGQLSVVTGSPFSTGSSPGKMVFLQ
jgi:6-phosphogluconolactonase (cycloisomerase 2 family)